MKIPRLWRRTTASGPRLFLSVADRTRDLGPWLAERGHPSDCVELFAAGVFASDNFSELVTELGMEAGGAAAVEPPAPPDLPGQPAVPVDPTRVGKILALGKNFHAHAAEFGEEVPSEPLFFNKLPELLVPDGAEVTVPAWYRGRVDHEAELAVWVGREGHSLDPTEALGYVAGYSVANDLTARSLQGADRKQGYPWFRGKNLDGFCPVGPCFVPHGWLDPGDLRVTAEVNGTPRQDASTAALVVGIGAALSYLSKHLTLRVGDLVLMGTPEGVGPLVDGDQVVCGVQGIGTIRTTLRRP